MKPLFQNVWLALLIPVLGNAQDVTYVSNLAAAPIGAASIGHNAWVAQSFFTGAGVSGFTLGNVEFLFNEPSGTPGALTASLYTGSPSGPVSSLTPLRMVTTPNGAGKFTFTATDVHLAGSTRYWVVLNAQGSPAGSSYTPRVTGYFDAVTFGGWGTDRYYLTSTNGTSWTHSPIGQDLQFSVSATVVPEPCCALLLLIGLAQMAWYRDRGKNIRVIQKG